MPAETVQTAKSDRRDLEPGRREAREIFVHAGLVVVRARLLATPAAELIWSALPIYSSIELPGGLPLLDASIAAAARGLPQQHQHTSSSLAHSELAIITSAQRVLISIGCSWSRSTNALTSAQSVPANRRHVFASAFDSVSPLLELEKGRSIALLEAAS